MFSIARTEIGNRVLTAKRLLASVRAIEGSSQLEAAAFKGLLLVQLYGIYENAVHAAVQALLSSIRTEALCRNELHYRALALVLNPEFVSVSSVGPTKMWRLRMELLAKLDSTETLHLLDDTLFPRDGSHYRTSQLQTIWAVFGLSTPIVPQPRHLARVNELVENRNAVAHGRRTAEDVGSRYSTLDIEKTIDDVEQIALHVVTQMETHYIGNGLRR